MWRVRYQLYVIGAVAHPIYYHEKPERPMTQAHQVATVTPLAVGAGAVLCTIFIHALALGATVNFFRRETRLGRAGMRYLIDLTIVVLVMSFAFVAHVVEITVWALLFMICGEFQDFGAAYYHSAVNYSTLGYGDVIMSPSWKLLGPLEAADGSLMFGVSTAMIFAVILRLIETRFADLKPK
jgi:Ion channel